MTRRRLRKTAAAGTTALVMTLATGLPAAAAGPADNADLVALTVEDAELRLSFRDDAQAEADPRSVRFSTSAEPVGVIPADPAFRFLGTPGAPVWSLQEGSPFSTFDTTAIGTGELTLELASIDGPGTFAAYRLSEWGRPTLLLDSDGKRSTRLPPGRRMGGMVWMFDTAGEYQVKLRATARTGSETLRDEAVYRISVASAAEVPHQAATEAPPAAKQQAAAAQKAATAQEAGTAQQAAAGRKVIDDGHVDMGPQLTGGALRIKLKDDSTTPPVWRELADVTLKVTDKAVIEVPSGAGYAFLGKSGDKVYLLPQSQQAGIVWPGWNTQHESVVKGTRGDVTWRLTKVSGPGGFKLFRTGSFGTPEVLFDSAKSLPQRLGIAPNTHAHGNWAFTRAGVYQLTVDMTATTTAGRSVSDTRVLSLAVGDTTGAAGGSGDSEDSDDDAESGGDLARTGTDIMSIAAGGALLLVAGVAVVVISRRRRDESTPDPS